MIPNLEVGLEVLGRFCLCCSLLHVGDGGSGVQFAGVAAQLFYFGMTF